MKKMKLLIVLSIVGLIFNINISYGKNNPIIPRGFVKKHEVKIEKENIYSLYPYGFMRYKESFQDTVFIEDLVLKTQYNKFLTKKKQLKQKLYLLRGEEFLLKPRTVYSYSLVYLFVLPYCILISRNF